MDEKGFVSGSENGVFFYETRVLSRYGLRVNGSEPLVTAHSKIKNFSWMGYYLIPRLSIYDDIPPDEGSGMVTAASQKSLELRVSRSVGDGFHEDLDLVNYTGEPLSFTFEIFFAADFADPAGPGAHCRAGPSSRP